MHAVVFGPRRLWTALLIAAVVPAAVWMLVRGAAQGPANGDAISVSVDEPDAPYHAEEVRFASGGNNLAGVLAIPRTAGPHPAVVFVHGSGPLTRNDFSVHPPLREHLARQGIASLCWDKPGVGGSTGDWTDQSFQNRAQEVLDSVEFLRRRNDIDQRHVGLWGISQGGWICPLATSLSPDVSFLILVSAPACTIAEQDLFRIEQGMRADGMPEQEITLALDFTRRRIDFFWNGSFDELDAAQRQVAGRRWFTNYVHRLGPRDFAFGARNIAYNGRPALQGVKCPVLIIVGERDTIVPSKESAITIKEILTKAGNPDVTIGTIPEADHFLQVTATRARAEMPREQLIRSLAPGYVSTVTDWLHERLESRSP